MEQLSAWWQISPSGISSIIRCLYTGRLVLLNTDGAPESPLLGVVAHPITVMLLIFADLIPPYIV